MIDSKQHYKMYKKGRQWLVMGITTSALVLGAYHELIGQAATTPSDQNTTTTTKAAAIAAKPATTVTLSTSAATAKTTTSASSSATSEASSATATLSQASTGSSSASQPATSTTATKSADSTATPTSSDSTATSASGAATSEAASQAPTSEATSSAPVTSQASQAISTTSTAKQPASENNSATNSETTSQAPVTASTAPTKLRSLARPQLARAAVSETIDQWMPNKVLQQAILDTLNRGGYGKTWASAADIQQTDLQLLTAFDIQGYSTYIDGKSSFSLAGLQYATNLTKLDLLNNINQSHHFRGDITDITPLAALSKLQWLQLACQRVSDVTPLATLTHLVNLNLSNNYIADFSSLDMAQYTEYFYIDAQVVVQDPVYVPVTGKYTMTNPIKPPKGMTLSLGDQVNGKAIFDIPASEPNPSVRLYYNGALDTLTGDQLSYQVTQNQIMPGPSALPGYTVIQNPFTYYLLSTIVDGQGNELASLFTPYIIANYAGDVTVNYVDEQGQPLAAADTLSGLIGENFTAQAKTLPGYQLVSTENSVTGPFTADTQTINFVYQIAYATITVHYQNAVGTTIKPDTTVTGQVGTTYAIDHPAILGYTYQSTNGNATGTYSETPTSITFIYTEAYSTVTVHYQNATGTPIQADTVLTGQIGTDFTVTPPAILGYTYQTTQGQPTGTYGETPTVVTFVYDEAYSTVTVHYLTVGGQTIQADTVLTGQIGTDYTIDYPEILGYTYQTTHGTPTGTYSDTPGEVSFIYQMAYGTVLVHYQTTNGTTIQPDATITGQIGTDYTVNVPEILGYTYQSTQGNAAGVYDATPAEVTLVYDLATSTVTVHYQDQNGKTIQADTVLSGQVGTEYAVSAPEILGYTHQSTQGEATGTYQATPSEVTFKYDMAKSTVTVHYQDQNGKTIQADTVLSGQVGTDYTVNAPEILGYTYQSTQGEATGTYQATPSEVTFRYDMAKSTVTVHYQDQDGKTIQTDTVLSGQVGTDYTVSAPKLLGYQYQTTYGEATGTYQATPSEVTFVYAIAQSTVTIHYQTDTGQTLQADTVLTGQVGSPYQVIAPEIAGYTYQVAQRTRSQVTGIYDEVPIEITLVYHANDVTPPVVTPEQTHQVTVHFVTEAGTQLAPDHIFTGQDGDSYTTTAATVAGYQLKTLPANASGILSADVDVTYVYEPVVDEGQGDTINPDTDQPTGDHPTTTQPATTQPIKKPAKVTGQPTTTALAAKIAPARTVKTNPVPTTLNKVKAPSATQQPADATATAQAKHALPQTNETQTSPFWGLALLGSLLGLVGLKRRQH